MRNVSGHPLWPSNWVAGDSRYSMMLAGDVERMRSTASVAIFTATQPAQAPPSIPSWYLPRYRLLISLAPNRARAGSHSTTDSGVGVDVGVPLERPGETMPAPSRAAFAYIVSVASM